MDLPGVLATAGRVPACLPGALALQCLAELALYLVTGTVTLRSNVSHAGLPPGQRYIHPGTGDTGKPPARVAWRAWRYRALDLDPVAGICSSWDRYRGPYDEIRRTAAQLLGI